MAYCVNCGVELSSSENKCPLCGVKVYRVEGMNKEEAGTPLYPKSVMNVSIGSKELLPALAVFFLIPILICVICDMLISHKLTWSTYVICAMMLAYVYVFLPFVLGKKRVKLYIGACTFATLLFLFFLSEKTNSGIAWFLEIGLPVCLGAGLLLIALNIVFSCFGNKKLAKIASVFFALGTYTVLINVCVNMFLKMQNILTWSLFSLVPCVIIGIGLLIIEKNTRLKSEVKRRFFI